MHSPAIHTTKKTRFRRQVFFLSVHVVLPLITGCCIYLFVRQQRSIAEGWLGWQYKPSLGLTASPFIHLFSGSFPDFCWLYALINYMSFTWGGFRKIPFPLLFLLVTLPLLSELLQALHVLKGTGDWWDAGAYIIAILFCKHNQYQKQSL